MHTFKGVNFTPLTRRILLQTSSSAEKLSQEWLQGYSRLIAFALVIGQVNA